MPYLSSMPQKSTTQLQMGRAALADGYICMPHMIGSGASEAAWTCSCRLGAHAAANMCCLQGIYVLQDTSFRWLLRLAPAAPPPDGTSRAEYVTAAVQPYLELPCGLIRGGLGGSGGGVRDSAHLCWDCVAGGRVESQLLATSVASSLQDNTILAVALQACPYTSIRYTACGLGACSLLCVFK